MVPGHCWWNELETTDEPGATAFYQALFGWSMEQTMPMGDKGDYRFVEAGGEQIGAINPWMADYMKVGWLPYFGVADIDAAKVAAEANGGTVTHDVHQVPSGDFIFTATDPAGAPRRPRRAQRSMTMTDSTGQICLWYEKDAEAAARFYAETFPNSSVGKIHKAPADNPSGQGRPSRWWSISPCSASRSWASTAARISSRARRSRSSSSPRTRPRPTKYWNAIVGNGGQESMCGWCKDKWGVSWQITPRILAEAMDSADPARAKRIFEAMMTDEEDRRRHARGRRRRRAGRRRSAITPLPFREGGSTEGARRGAAGERRATPLSQPSLL